MDPLLPKENTTEEKPRLSHLRQPRFWAMCLGIIIFISLLFFWLTRSNSQGGIITIAEGDSLSSISNMLETDGYVRSHTLFSTFVTFLGGEHHIQKGDYQIDAHESTLGIAYQIAFGKHNIVPIRITIPEGETVNDIKKLLSEKIPNFDAELFEKNAKSFEGYLFPETYFFFPKTTPDLIINDMKNMFDQKTKDIFAKSTLTYSKKDIVIMASLVEREAHGSNDRSQIAGILWNRISIGMPLQVDATVAYANGVGEGALTKALFLNPSPFNTYQHKGLPPAPIANPGLLAIEAAANSTHSHYLYYLHDKNGNIHFATTYSEHLQNINKYLR